MKGLLLILGLSFYFISCEKADAVSYSLDGKYTGIFYRTGLDTVPVTLFFDGDRFEGQGSRPYYPAVCHGSFELDYTTIHFYDSCAWTANFDWSLILTGAYNIQISDGTVRIWKTHDSITDEYLLRQPYR